MFLFVGLGNIGKEFEDTRHNFGFLCVNSILSKFSYLNHEVKFNADIYTLNIEQQKILIVKPRTYMNRSGISISQIKSFYKILLDKIFVFHDDLDLDFCRIKYKIGGGSGGHNGLKSLDEMIGKNYHRIRLGIGRSEFKNDISNFVLQKFNNDELKKIENLNNKIIENIQFLFTEDKSLFMNKIYL